MPFPWIVSLSLGLLALYFLKRTMLDKTVPGPLPPGPRRKPILGNITDLPPKGEQDWMHWVKHKQLYGKTYSSDTDFKFEDILISIQGQSVLLQFWGKQLLLSTI
jgi:hypothetical protein